MTPPLETLSAWFWDFLGLAPSKRYKKKYDNMSLKEQAAFRKRKAARVYSKEDRRMLANKSFTRGNVHEGVNMFMIRRKEKQLGTYGSKKHVVVQKFNELQAANYQELIDISGAQTKLRARDSKGRFISG